MLRCALEDDGHGWENGSPALTLRYCLISLLAKRPGDMTLDVTLSSHHTPTFFSTIPINPLFLFCCFSFPTPLTKRQYCNESRLRPPHFTPLMEHDFLYPGLGWLEHGRSFCILMMDIPRTFLYLFLYIYFLHAFMMKQASGLNGTEQCPFHAMGCHDTESSDTRGFLSEVRGEKLDRCYLLAE